MILVGLSGLYAQELPPSHTVIEVSKAIQDEIKAEMIEMLVIFANHYEFARIKRL